MAPFSRVGYICVPSVPEGTSLLSSRIDIYSENGFTFPAGRASASITVLRLPECMIFGPGIPRKIVYYQEVDFRVKDVCEWAHEHLIPWYYTALPTSCYIVTMPESPVVGAAEV